MRVKISTKLPLPKLNCWFLINEKLENQTVHQLSKALVQYLELPIEPIELNLSMDDFILLPQSKIKNLLRDNDLLILKQERLKSTLEKKRKAVSDDDKQESKSKKTKQDILEKEKNKKKESKERSKDKKEETKEKSKDKKSKEKKKDKKSKEKKIEKTSTQKVDDRPSKKVKEAVVEKPENGLPFEGTKKTQSRNLRRKLLKQRYREQQSNDMNSVTTSSTNHNTTLSEDTTTAPEYNTPEYNTFEDNTYVPEYNTFEDYTYAAGDSTFIAEDIAPTAKDDQISMEKLIKKNKNKKKNHLKGPKAEKKNHVHFDDVPTIINPYGRAFITLAESEPNPKIYHNQPIQYPIHEMPTLFYAKKPAEQNSVEEEQHIEATIVNYDEYPDVNLANDTVPIGTELAIKTLELTANYTPEISDWKAVILKELDYPNTITIEFKTGHSFASTKGGKFDNASHQRQREVEVYEEEYSEDDSIATIPVADLYSIKIISAV